MSIELIFSKYQDIWDDCYLGYVILDNKFPENGLDSILGLVSVEKEFDFYPWLNEKEPLKVDADSLKEVDLEMFSRLFLDMALETIAYGSHKRISVSALNEINREFIGCFSEARYFSNFSQSGWRPVTAHSRDSFLCVVSKDKVGMWLTCDDE